MSTKNNGLAPNLDNQTRRAFNQLAREQLKRKLLADILVDMKICEIEGWDKLEYLNELKNLINGFYERNKKNIKLEKKYK